MIYLNQFKHVEVSLHGKIRRNKLYLCTCNKCGVDRGYQSKSHKSLNCNTCAQNNRIISNEHRVKMSSAATKRYNDPAWAPKEKVKKGHSLNKTRIYNKTKSVLQIKMAHNMRCLLSSKLRNRGLSKFRQKTFEMMGYSVDELIVHLELKFKPGMTWSNYGEWEIDHIQPDSWFQYDSKEDKGFKDSWKLDNLRPYWKCDNASDGARKCHKV